MNTKLISSIFMILISSDSISKEIFLATPYGTFTSCQKAIEFRDGQLFNFLDKAFEGATDSAKVDRYNATLEEFQLHKKAAALALKTASREQRQEMMLTITKAIAFHKLGKVSDKLLKTTFPNLSDTELKNRDVFNR